MDESNRALVTWLSSLVQSKNGVWCKSRVYCCHISRYLVKTTLRILGQQIRAGVKKEKKNMSSYYVDSLLCKSAPGSSVFPIVERASCGIGPGGENSRTAAVTFTPTLPGVYSVNNAAYQSLNPVFTSGYGLGRDIHPQDCSSPLDQGRLFSQSCCHPGPGHLTSPPDKQYRMYPWMRASGKF